MESLHQLTWIESSGCHTWWLVIDPENSLFLVLQTMLTESSFFFFFPWIHEAMDIKCCFSWFLLYILYFTSRREKNVMILVSVTM
jgi:hypothetical protein